MGRVVSIEDWAQIEAGGADGEGKLFSESFCLTREDAATIKDFLAFPLKIPRIPPLCSSRIIRSLFLLPVLIESQLEMTLAYFIKIKVAPEVLAFLKVFQQHLSGKESARRQKHQP